jgi:hypothetical protein
MTNADESIRASPLANPRNLQLCNEVRTTNQKASYAELSQPRPIDEGIRIDLPKIEIKLPAITFDQGRPID